MCKSELFENHHSSSQWLLSVVFWAAACTYMYAGSICVCVRRKDDSMLSRSGGNWLGMVITLAQGGLLSFQKFIPLKETWYLVREHSSFNSRVCLVSYVGLGGDQSVDTRAAARRQHPKSNREKSCQHVLSRAPKLSPSTTPGYLEDCLYTGQNTSI